MAIQHKNRLGDTYYLHFGETKTGRPNYYFSMKAAGPPAEALPRGFEIYESPRRQVFASRIESANKEYGTELLISEDVYHQVAGKCAITSSIENAVIKGKSGTHVLYAVHALAEDKCLSEL